MRGLSQLKILLTRQTVVAMNFRILIGCLFRDINLYIEMLGGDQQMLSKSHVIFVL